MRKITLLCSVLLTALVLQAQDPYQTLNEYWTEKLPKLWLEYDYLMPSDTETAFVQKNDLCGWIGIDGKVAVAPKYEYADAPDTGDFIRVVFRNKYGICTPDGKEVLPPEFDQIKTTKQGFRGRKNLKYLDYSFDGKLMSTPFSGKIVAGMAQQNGYTEATTDYTFWGIADASGKWSIEPQYNSVNPLGNGYWSAQLGRQIWLVHPATQWQSKSDYKQIGEVTANGFWGRKEGDHSVRYFDFQEQPIKNSLILDYIPESFFESPDKNYVSVQQSHKSGLMDRQGNLVLPTRYETVYPLQRYENTVGGKQNKLKDIFIVGNSDSLALFNGQKWLTEPRFSSFTLLRQYIVGTTPEGAYLYNKEGQFLKQINLPNASVEGQFLYSFTQKDSVWHYKNGWVRLPPNTKVVSFQPQGIMVTNRQNKSVLLDMTGKIIRTDYDRNGMFWQQFADQSYILSSRKNGLWGWTLADGSFQQPAQYDQINPLTRGLVLVRKNLRWGLVDYKGRVIVPMEYDEVNGNSPFLFKKDGVWRVFKEDGMPWIEGTFTAFRREGEGIWLENQEKWSLYNKKGDPVMPALLTTKVYTAGSGFLVRKNDKQGAVDIHSQFVHAIEWDSLSLGYGLEWGRKGNQLTIFSDGNYPEVTTAATEAQIEYSIGFAVHRGPKWHFIKFDGSPFTQEGYINWKRLNNKKIALIGQRDKGRWDLINSKGKILKTISADSIYYYVDDYLVVAKGSEKKLLQTATFKIEDLQYEQVFNSVKGFYVTHQNNKWGLANAKFEEIIPCKYSNINMMEDGYCIVYDSLKTGLLYKDGRFCIPLDEYDSGIEILSNDIFASKKQGQVGIYSKKEQQWIPNSMEDIKNCQIRVPLAKELFLIRIKGLYGIMDGDCNHIVQPEYTEITDGNGLILLLRRDKQTLLYNPVTRKIISGLIDSVMFAGDLVVGQTAGVCSIYNGDGVVFTRKSERSEVLGDRHILFLQEKYGLMRPDGSVILPPVYHAISIPNGEIIAADQAGKIGFFDLEGKPILPFEYSGFSIRNALIELQQGPLKGISNMEGLLILPVQFDHIKLPAFESDQFVAQYRGKYQFFNSQGQRINDSEWENAGCYHYGLAPVQKKGLWGYVDLSGKLIIPHQFQYAGAMTDNWATVIKDSLYFTIDASGKIVNEGATSSDFSEDVNFREMPAYQQIPFDAEPYPWYGFYWATDPKTKKMGWVNLLGQWKMRPAYDETVPVSNHKITIATVRMGKLWGTINNQGNILLAPQFSSINTERDGIFKVTKDGETYLINENGQKQ